ncbi:MAG: ParB/RepB/Spo0J family partition protein [Sulfurimonas sp.]|nr:ParB/RepB/Spo0J family partition protein [Sulfurimonas sp.]
MKVSNITLNRKITQGELVCSTNNNIFVNVNELKYEKRVLATDGDIQSFHILKMNIQEHGVLVPIVIDENYNVLSGSRRVIIAKSLNIQKIPAVIVNKDLNEAQKAKLEIDLHLSSRKMSYLEISLLIFELHKESHTKTKTVQELAEYLKCDTRSIHSKIAHVKSFHKLSPEVQSILYEADSREAIERIVFENICLLGLNFNLFEKEILSLNVEDITNSILKSILSKLKQKKNEADRNQTIDKQMAEIEQKTDSVLLEITDLPAVKKTETPDYSQAAKIVLQYEIKKLFNQSIDKKEMLEAEALKETYSIDFHKEIALIQSLLH